MSMSTGMSGLQAASEDLNIISNNIANANTVGYKSMDVQFADVYSATGSTGGVYVSDIKTDFSQGTMIYTSNTTDLAIDGEGYFILTDANGQEYYTRAGNFDTDKDGNLVNSSGQQVMGYAVDDNGNIIEGQLEPIAVDTADMPAKATEEAEIVANLDSRSEEIDQTATPFDSSDPSTYHSTTTTVVYDSQGNEQQVTAYYVKTGENEWQVHYEAGGEEVMVDDPNSPGNPIPYTVSMEFDANGEIIASSDSSSNTPHAKAGEFGIPLDFQNGTAPMNLTMDLTGMSQYGNEFSVSSNSQDGYAAGSFYGVTISDDGAIVATYANGQSDIQGYVAIATFPNDNGLEAAGNTSWIAGIEAGDPIYGLPGTGSAGSLSGGALENSNVDMNTQLVDMIVAQSAYQANTKSISTFDENLTTLINTF